MISGAPRLTGTSFATGSPRFVITIAPCPSATSATPLYAQIAGRLRIAIAAGELRPGGALPSVRHLAAQLRLNPATVVQAYRELEDDGFVEMRQGAGTFVREVAPEGRARERARQ